MPCEHGWQRPKRDCLICASPTVPALPEEVDALTFAEAQAVIAEKDAAYAGATKKLHEYRRQLATINQIAQGLASALDSHGPYLPTDPAHAALRALAAYQQRKGK